MNRNRTYPSQHLNRMNWEGHVSIICMIYACVLTYSAQENKIAIIIMHWKNKVKIQSHKTMSGLLHSPSAWTPVSCWNTPKHPCRVTNWGPGRALVKTSTMLPDVGIQPTTISSFSMHSQIQWYFTLRCFTWLWKAWSLQSNTAAELSHRRGVACCCSKLSSRVRCRARLVCGWLQMLPCIQWHMLSRLWFFAS